MRLVILESPYRGLTKEEAHRYRVYALLALRDCYERGEAPIASHMLGPQVLSDDIPHERNMGIEAGLEWHKVAEAAVFYIDYGKSIGMLRAERNAQAEGLPREYRTLNTQQQALLRDLLAASGKETQQ